jgi:CHAT domain-containing protein
VLATLWDLADEPAQFLMHRFYTHWLRGGTKAAALRAAQLDLIRALRAGAITAKTPFGATKLTERPALWASFVLLGEP